MGLQICSANSKKTQKKKTIHSTFTSRNYLWGGSCCCCCRCWDDLEAELVGSINYEPASYKSANTHTHTRSLDSGRHASWPNENVYLRPPFGRLLFIFLFWFEISFGMLLETWWETQIYCALNYKRNKINTHIHFLWWTIEHLMAGNEAANTSGPNDPLSANFES